MTSISAAVASTSDRGDQLAERHAGFGSLEQQSAAVSVFAQQPYGSVPGEHAQRLHLGEQVLWLDRTQLEHRASFDLRW
jgi:hypothetical protein